MGLGSFFKNIGSNIASGAKKTRNFLNTAKTGITNAISEGSKKAWSAVKEYGPELAGMALKGVEQIAPHFGPIGDLVHKASKAVSPHISKALGEKFDKGYNRYKTKDQPTYNKEHLNESSGVTSKIDNHNRKPGQLEGFKARVNFR